ncbi:MAG: hypothetical protein ACKPEA_17930 [Planctomycetota bacterium]
MTEGSSIRRVLAVAWRDFRHTALTKGFIVGAVVVPAIMLAAVPLIPLLSKAGASPIEGRIVVIDRIGGVCDAFRSALLEKEASQVESDETRGGSIEIHVEVQAADATADQSALSRQVGEGALTALLVASRDGTDGSVDLLVPSTASPRHTRRL